MPFDVRSTFVVGLAGALLLVPAAVRGYSVLSHEANIDAAGIPTSVRSSPAGFLRRRARSC